MREKRLALNIFVNILLQPLLAVSGFLIPRLIMSYWGSSVNGMMSSVTQFLVYASLVEAGVGDASIVALYKPLAEKDNIQVSEVLASTKKMYRKAGILYTLLSLLFSGIYPRMIGTQLAGEFVAMMVLVLSMNNIVDYFVLGKYKVLLLADQRFYIYNLARCIETLLSVTGCSLMLIKGRNILEVKLLAVLLHMSLAGAIWIYVRHRYRYIQHKAKKHAAIDQRWNALVHQVCATVVYNTDLVVLTLFLPGKSLLEMSVYTTYAMVSSMVNSMIGAMATGINASFGNMYAKNEENSLLNAYHIYEFVYYIILFVLYNCLMLLVMPFMKCYTKGINDVNYIRAGVGVLFTLNGFLANLKRPGELIISAAGMFRETQANAVVEATVNIVISILLVTKFGIMGVLAGTFVSHLIMYMLTVGFVQRKLIPTTKRQTYHRIGRNLIISGVVFIVEGRYIILSDSWMIWLLQASVIFIVNCIIFIVPNFWAERDNARVIASKIRKLAYRKVEQSHGLEQE